MRPLRHLTPRYVIDRSALIVRERRHPKAPWLTARAAEIIEGWLNSEDTVFEWGSGRSTAWFATQAGRVISVEHDPVWYANVTDQLRMSEAPVVERYLKESNDGVADAASEAYISVIDSIDDEAIDLVLVDGIHRHKCANRALPKIRPGGMLVVDNADWFVATASRTPRRTKLLLRNKEWERLESAVGPWRRINTTNGVWDTVLWIKPPT